MARLANCIAGRKVYIYGNGKVGKRLHKILDASGIDVCGHVISGGQKQIANEIYIDEVMLSEDTVMIIGVGKKLTSDIEAILMDRGIKEY